MDEKVMPNFLDVEFYPDLELEGYKPKEGFGIPLENLASLSSAFKPINDLVKNLTSTNGSGIYRIVDNSKPLTKATDGSGYLGIVRGVDGKISEHARFTKVAFDPVTLTAALATMAIEQKLNAINEGQKNILEFLELKEKVKIKANINTLVEIINNYKYNYDNTQYRASNHMLVRTIKKEADESMLLFDSLLTKKADGNSGFHRDKKIEGYISEAVDKINEYQLSLYAFAFASLLDIVLLENFEHKYINSVLGTIYKAQERYETTFTKVEEKIAKDAAGSIETSVLKGVSKIGKTLGKVATKTPFIGKTKLDQTLTSSGEKIDQVNEEKVSNKVNILSEMRKDLIKPLIENIKMINVIYNDTVNILFDKNNIYLEA